MKYISFLLLISLLFACTEENKELENKEPKESQKSADEENLIETVGNVYTEYYPGKKAVKIRGELNDNEERQGKWSYYSETGTELSMSYYENGKRQGHSIVKYPNGAVNYFGAYKDDKPVGVWETYSPEGKLISKKDYSTESN